MNGDPSLEAIASAYDLSPRTIWEPQPRGFNDHCRVTDGDTRYHVRAYLEGKYYIANDAEIDFELAATETLAAAGLPVARPFRNADGELRTRLSRRAWNLRWRSPA